MLNKLKCILGFHSYKEWGTDKCLSYPLGSTNPTIERIYHVYLCEHCRSFKNF